MSRYEEYHPVGVYNLACSIMEQGVEDAKQGDPMAISWLDSRDFDHWCTWLDIDPDAARVAVKARVSSQGKFAQERLDRVIDLHDLGEPWEQSIIRVFGYFSETIRLKIQAYANEGRRG